MTQPDSRVIRHRLKSLAEGKWNEPGIARDLSEGLVTPEGVKTSR